MKHINHPHFQTQCRNSLWKYVNTLFAFKSPKPQRLQRNSLHLFQQPTGATDRIIPLPGLLTTFAWEKTNTYRTSRKGFSRIKGVGYQRKGSCWQLTYLQHAFLKPGWSFSHCLLTAEMTRSGSYSGHTWHKPETEQRLRKHCDLPVEIRPSDQSSSIWIYNLFFLLYLFF